LSGFFVSFDVIPLSEAPLQQCAPLQAYVSALQKQRLRSSIPYVVTYIMRPVVFTSAWGLEGLGMIVVQARFLVFFLLLHLSNLRFAAQLCPYSKLWHRLAWIKACGPVRKPYLESN
jgi:hypothetical protein